MRITTKKEPIPKATLVEKVLSVHKDFKAGQIIRAIAFGWRYTDTGTPGGPSWIKPGEVARVEACCDGYLLLTDTAGVSRYLHTTDRTTKKLAALIEGEDATVIDEKITKESKVGFTGTSKFKLFSIGTDPEFFVLNAKGKVIPAFLFLPSVDERKDNAPFWDGFQAEINPTSSTCHQSLQSYVLAHLLLLQRALLKHDPKARLVARSVVDVDTKFLKGLPDEYVRLGCAPSMSAYGVEPLEVLDPRSLPYRSAGCHIHFGCGPQPIERVERIVKAMDAIAAVAMVSLFQGVEDPRRRLLYGRAGEYRLPKHGLEYRVPPAEVMAHPMTYHLCFDLTRQAFSVGLYNYLSEWDGSEAETREVVDTCDWKQAGMILKRNKTMLRRVLSHIYGDSTVSKSAETLLVTGAKEWLDLNDMTKWWGLADGKQAVSVKLLQLNSYVDRVKGLVEAKPVWAAST